MNLNLWNQLTHAEKLALEQKHDFGITDQHVQDTIRLRSVARVATVESLTACIKEEMDYLPWVRAQRAKSVAEGHDPKVWDQRIACMLTRIDELDRKLAALTAMQVAAE